MCKALAAICTNKRKRFTFNLSAFSFLSPPLTYPSPLKPMSKPVFSTLSTASSSLASLSQRARDYNLKTEFSGPDVAHRGNRMPWANQDLFSPQSTQPDALLQVPLCFRRESPEIRSSRKIFWPARSNHFRHNHRHSQKKS